MKSAKRQKAGRMLSSAGLRRTGPRAAVLTALLTADKPQTAEQIAAKLTPAAADRVTIYRTLESLLDAGIVHKAFLRERTWHFELAHNCTESQCHPHFTCTECGSTHCLTGISPPMARSPYKGFVIRRQQVQFEGLCPKCSSSS